MRSFDAFQIFCKGLEGCTGPGSEARLEHEPDQASGQFASAHIDWLRLAVDLQCRHVLTRAPHKCRVWVPFSQFGSATSS